MSGSRELYVDRAEHRAVIDVNEEGTEAAAATAMSDSSMGPSHRPPPREFRCDHPFLYLIRSRPQKKLAPPSTTAPTSSGDESVIYFMGHFVKPPK